MKKSYVIIIFSFVFVIAVLMGTYLIPGIKIPVMSKMRYPKDKAGYLYITPKAVKIESDEKNKKIEYIYKNIKFNLPSPIQGKKEKDNQAALMLAGDKKMMMVASVLAEMDEQALNSAYKSTDSKSQCDLLNRVHASSPDQLKIGMSSDEAIVKSTLITLKTLLFLNSGKDNQGVEVYSFENEYFCGFQFGNSDRGSESVAVNLTGKNSSKNIGVDIIFLNFSQEEINGIIGGISEV